MWWRTDIQNQGYLKPILSIIKGKIGAFIKQMIGLDVVVLRSANGGSLLI